MSKTLEFIFDFGSPNAYLAYQLLPGILQRTGAKLKILPCLLGGIFKATGNQPPMMAFGGVKGKLEYEQKEMDRFIQRHALNAFRFNPHFPVNTLLLMRGAIAAEEEGSLEAYLEAGLAAMWEEGLKMDDPEVYVTAMDAAGLDGQTLLERTREADVKAHLIRNTEQAVERGVFGIPTFFVGEEMFFGKDRLDQVEQELSR
ncbi:2-hydroxychromene-2-carboxylate isomerase [Seongchinamella sediminis]|uniref:2-hydroxychromene-2-carboxylate isomerase n=1 Tax=Seongchinamella sediminis TaxID=2283635 RepID=A0A3L7DSP7_9GAMM|nr:2-hydroxychromene-2-carboxylate isomerase [Seongchinamella sediminis]RLQ20687.1 2-hydroxychromene-2-carboxylate isomerase [Seongchinamella sediminis]